MFQGKTCVLITGASQGFGQAVSKCLARELSENMTAQDCVFVLIARSQRGLAETKKIIQEASSSLTVCIDLADLNNLEDAISSIFELVDPREFTSGVLINNAASVGDKIKSITGQNNVLEIQKYMDLNITSCFYLTSRFLSHFASTQNYVINISSLSAIKAMPSLSLYCSGKAARDMFHQVLASESETRVLNYAPGPMDTDMYNSIMNHSDSDYMRHTFQKMKSEDKVLNTETSADKLVFILKQDRYVSGNHVDFFDYMP